MTRPTPTTHDEKQGLAALRLSRAQRLGWARGILDDIETHSDARIRRACRTILNHSADHAEHQLAKDLWRMVNDGKSAEAKARK
ncbi:hypothetical protein SAMN04488005_1535 [Yoonia tamlensis]|uniref:Uncharacterized protein n=1 Tax=Yoonia tamlensis TaxID=390270 RepID=A0A1I6GEM1_9RHOB|nr:hypothetical protein [Yoonia tamlensis]SFR40655.1 hypothetical protein SAMN04488005_1535 [Yoonia tamlensis]